MWKECALPPPPPALNRPPAIPSPQKTHASSSSSFLCPLYIHLRPSARPRLSYPGVMESPTHADDDDEQDAEELNEALVAKAKLVSSDLDLIGAGSLFVHPLHQTHTTRRSPPPPSLVRLLAHHQSPHAPCARKPPKSYHGHVDVFHRRCITPPLKSSE